MRMSRTPPRHLDLSRSHPPLHFAHANGFPSACYAKLLGLLAADYGVGFLATSGHDPRYPVSDGWPGLVDELIASIRTRGRAPMIGVGHSLGGYLMLLAAARMPQLFRCVILLDAPLLGRFRGSALQFIKHIGLVDRVTPAGRTRNRRSQWPSQGAALAHFRRKPLFQRFDPDCLLDYVRFGTRSTPGGFELVFDPAVEYQIYRTLPHDITEAARDLAVPAGLIAGRDSDIVARLGLAQSRRFLRVQQIDGGHLFPLERPWEAALAVRNMARSLSGL